MEIFEMKMTPQIAKWGWFCAKLKEQFNSTFVVLLNLHGGACLKMFKYERNEDGSNGKCIGYKSGKELIDFLKEEYIHYCKFHISNQKIQQIGEDRLEKMIESDWNDMISVSTIGKESLTINRY